MRLLILFIFGRSFTFVLRRVSENVTRGGRATAAQSTGAPWRGRGVASALIVRALGALRDRGMTEAALGVDAQNETGALRLYEAMGFREAARETEWRRPLFLDAAPALGTEA